MAKTAMMHNYVFLPVFDRMSVKSQASCQSAICSIGRRQNILLNATGLLMLLFTLEGVKHVEKCVYVQFQMQQTEFLNF